MGITNLPDLGVVSGTSGYVSGNSNPFDGSFDNPISGWNTPAIIKYWPDKTKFQFSSDDRKSHIRYDDDREGRHLHYENRNDYGFRFTFYLSDRLTYPELYEIAQEFKSLGNGFVRDVRRLAQRTKRFYPQISLSITIMRFCPHCSSEISAASKICPVCKKEL